MLRSLVLGMYKFGSLSWNWSKNVGPEDRFVLGITALVKRDRRCGSFQDESTLGGNMMMAGKVRSRSQSPGRFTISSRALLCVVTLWQRGSTHAMWTSRHEMFEKINPYTHLMKMIQLKEPYVLPLVKEQLLR
ncbi:hypothetical protein Peur_001864 [Populus x canadensis]